MNKSKHTEEFIYPLVKAGHLRIDKQGRIWRVSRTSGGLGGFLRFSVCDKRRGEFLRAGYWSVKAQIDNIERSTGSHRLVYRHFFGPINGDLTVNHKDGNKLNNRPSNLELATHSEQRLHAVRILGVWVREGEEIPWSKVTASQVREIRNRRMRGEKLSSLSYDFGLSESAISEMCLRHTWRSVA